jgi:hypothetical protein
VNFFGHAVVASWEARAPGFVLGAMLPDFASMCGGRLAEIDHPELRAGIALHHRTDRVFHAASRFVALCQDARRTLQARGLGRGHAYAVGHVGVELLLDGWLVDQPKAREAYAAALRCGRPGELGGQIRWLDEEGRGRWRRLHRRLEAHGPPDDYRDPTLVASRIERILRDRPRLALDARRTEITARYLPELQQAVHARGAALICELRLGLTEETGEPTPAPRGTPAGSGASCGRPPAPSPTNGSDPPRGSRGR